MAINSSQIPLGHPISDSNMRVNQQWAFWFQQVSQLLPPAGTNCVVNGDPQTAGQQTIYQGLDANK